MKNQPATHFPELITSLDYVNPIIKKLFPHHLKNTPLTGRITNFVSKWSKLANDKEIIQIVKSLKIQFLERPSQKQPLAETKMSLEEKKLVNTEVQELLRKGAITPAQVSEDQFVSNIFLRLKEDGCFHLIINLKKLNQFISIFALQNGRPKTTKRFSQAKRFNVKNKSQRCQHSLHPETHKYVRFQWKGNLYQFPWLCFGLEPAPRIFTKLLKISISILWRINI